MTTKAFARELVADLRTRRKTDAEARAAAARVLGVTEAAVAAALGLKAERVRAPRPPRRPTPPAPAWARRPGYFRPVETCAQGHPFGEKNENAIVRPNGSRRCRTCHRAAVARHEAKRAKIRVRAKPDARPYRTWAPGDTLGRFTLVSREGGRWLVRCECGREVRRGIFNLEQGLLEGRDACMHCRRARA